MPATALTIPRRTRFRLSLLVAIPALVLLTGGLIVFFTLSNTRRTMEDFGWALFREATKESINETRNIIREAIPDIETLGNLWRKNLFSRDMNWQARYFTELLRSHREYSWVSFGDERGTFSGAYRPDTAGAPPRLNVSWLNNGRTISYDYEVLPNGQQKLYKFEPDTGYDPRKRPFYQLAQKAGKRVWTPPYIFYEQAVPGITCSLPVYTGSRLEGVFSIDFDLNALSDIVARARVSQRGVVFIYTENGEILGHPTMKVVSKAGQRAEGRILTVSDIQDENIKAFFAALRQDQKDSPNGSGETSRNFHVKIQGDRFLASYSRFAIDDGLFWNIGIIAPESDFRGIVEVRENYKRAYAISFAAILLSGMLAWLFTRMISSPLRSISLDMERVGRLEIESGAANSSPFKEISLMDEHLQNMKGGLRSFASYVPKDLVRDLLKSGKEARLEGSTETLTVLFTDIAGFTSFAEQLEPDELVQKLGKYFEIMTVQIMKNRGTIDKFIGDGIMAFWGAPAADQNHAIGACLAALACKEALRQMAESPEYGHWARHLSTRFGIATGPVVVGNIGTRERMNYTVMGDTVNLASRLEGVNKVYGTAISASDSTYNLVRAQIVGRTLDLVAVKGKSHGVRIFEILCRRDGASAADLELEKISEQCLDAFIARDMATAKKFCLRILELRADDKSANLLLRRIAEYEGLEDQKSWSPVNAMLTK
ncbi:MAG TPA: adenylate/guanylate cyclase domain-containing protein [Turneriella sp.]|nr:adenylate/guanylate cyclase domain-containing protein [Turneriella sp.]